MANVYLHIALDQWFTREVQPRLRGRSKLVRYADDFVIVFSDERDDRTLEEHRGFDWFHASLFSRGPG